MHREARRFDRLDQRFDCNKLNLLTILMIHEHGPAFVSHRTKIFLHCTNPTLIMTSRRALAVIPGAQ